jgi:hypothetical protein
MLIEELGLEILGKGDVVKVGYKFILSNGFWYEYTYDSLGNILTYKNSNGYWNKYTRDKLGNKLTHKSSRGYWSETTRDASGNQLTHKRGNINRDK